MKPVVTIRHNRRVALLIVCALAIAGAPLLGSATAQTTGTEGVWELTGSLSVPRYDHTTTLLNNGKVLAAGGRRTDNTENFRSAELYDPLTGTWTPTGDMNVYRWQHTATLLPDGRVLVAGGFNGTATGSGASNQAVLNSAEIYDPATGTWTPTASMNVRRAVHVAVPLPDGQVLVAGGRTCDQPPPTTCSSSARTNTAEIYDPSAGTWAPTGAMTQARHTTAATVLQDGRVLVPAGFTAAGNGTDGDLYNPATGTWSSTGNLNVARARQGAMLLPDGRVMVAFGFGGEHSAELYDPATNTWGLADSLDYYEFLNRFNFAYTVMPNGKALVAGGQTTTPNGLTLNSDIYDPATNQWFPGGLMNATHGTSSSSSNSFPAVVLSASATSYVADPAVCGANCGKVLVAGFNPTGVSELYTASTIEPTTTTTEPTTSTVPPTTTTTTLPPDAPVRFAPASTFTTTTFNPWHVAQADFNRDGVADLAVASPFGFHPSGRTGGDISVHLGTGSGSFGPPAHFPVGEGPRSLAVGDFNGDGAPDLVVANSGSDSVSVLLGTGTGGFGAATHFPVPAGTLDDFRQPQYVTVGDFNRDGFTDLAVTIFTPPMVGNPPGEVAVLLGTGTGSFGAVTNFAAGYGTTSVAVGDFNEDAIPDLAVANLLGNNLAVLLGTGTGAFGPPTPFTGAGINPNSVAVRDLNGDGFEDLAVAMLDGGVSVHLGTGTGTFGAPTNYPAGDRPWWVSVGDFDGDAIPDLAVANDDSDNVSVLLGTGTGSFGAPINFPAGDGPFSIAVGDFDGDARPDLAVANSGSHDVSILLNTTVPLPARHVVADFDANRTSDVSVFRPSTGEWFVQGGTDTAWGTSGDLAVAGDYDGDNDVDVAVYRPSTGVWYVQGAEAVAWGTTGDIAVPGDYTGDGKTDRAVFRPSDGIWYIQNGPAIAWGTDGDIPVPGDYDSDGKVDVAVYRPSTGVWYVHTSSAAPDTVLFYGTTGDIPVPGDYDGDAETDIAVYRPSEGAWYIHNSTGADTITVWGIGGDIPAPGDYDNDGNTDIAVFRPSEGVWYIHNSSGADTAVSWGISGDAPVPLPSAIRGAFF